MPAKTDMSGSMKELAEALNKLTNLVKASADEVKAEPDLGRKLDVLIRQNEDMAKALLLLLEINREHLPNISKHVKATAEATRPRHSRPHMHQSAGYRLPGFNEETPPPPPI